MIDKWGGTTKAVWKNDTTMKWLKSPCVCKSWAVVNRTNLRYQTPNIKCLLINSFTNLISLLLLRMQFFNYFKPELHKQTVFTYSKFFLPPRWSHRLLHDDYNTFS